MRSSKMVLAMALALGSLTLNPAFAAGSDNAPQTAAVSSIDQKTELIGKTVNEAEDSMQKTYDDLRKEGGKFGKGWANIDEGFVYYSTTESEYFRALLDYQETLCRNFADDVCVQIAADSLLKAADGMKIRAEILRKVAFNEKLDGLDRKLTQDPATPLFRTLLGLVSDTSKTSLTTTGRLYLKMKMTYLGLISELAKFHKNPQLEALIETEMSRLDEERAELLNSIYKLSGQEPVEPRKIGEKRRKAMIYEFAS